MISHAQAQALVSARLDGPLTLAEDRELQLHLLGCAACRRFAEQTDALARGLRELPRLPPSPSVSRQVMEGIRGGRSPWAWLTARPRLAPSSTMAALGSLVLVAALAGSLVLAVNLAGNGGDRGVEPQNIPAPAQEMAQSLTTTPTETPTPTDTPSPTPTERAAATVILPTATAELPAPTGLPGTANDVPTSTAKATAVPPTATSTPRINVRVTVTPTAPGSATSPNIVPLGPTATPLAPTVAPAPVLTPVPADETPAPTAAPIETPVPTPTAVPVATATPLPTVTATLSPAPTIAPTETPVPGPALIETPLPTATFVPTETPVPPTATSVPPTLAPIPTVTPLPAVTVTPEPTATNTPPPTVVAIATAAPEPTPTLVPVSIETPELPPIVTPEPPPIVPIEGAAPVEGEQATAEVVLDTPTPASVEADPADAPVVPVPESDGTTDGSSPTDEVPGATPVAESEIRVVEAPAVEVPAEAAPPTETPAPVEVDAPVPGGEGGIEAPNEGGGIAPMAGTTPVRVDESEFPAVIEPPVDERASEEPAPVESVAEPASAIDPQAFDAGAWQGAEPISADWCGRPCVAIYGWDSGRSRATLGFDLPRVPAGGLMLAVTGLGDESGAPFPFTIEVNGVSSAQFEGVFANWNADQGAPGGNAPWSVFETVIPASLLQAGGNEIALVGLAPGGNVGLPPYLLLSDATLTPVGETAAVVDDGRSNRRAEEDNEREGRRERRDRDGDS